MAGRSVNKVILVGHLTKDAETALTQSQVSVTKFSIATNRRWKDSASGEWREEADFHNIVQWRAENLAPYLTKGKQIYVEGRLQTRSYEKDGIKRYVTEVIAEDVILLGGGGREGGEDREERPRSAPRARQQPAQTANYSEGIDDTYVPF